MNEIKKEKMMQGSDGQKNIKYKQNYPDNDRRYLSRIPVRKNEGMTAVLHIPGSNQTLDFNVINISTMGICLESCDSISHMFMNGDRVDMELVCKNNIFNFTYAICHIKIMDNHSVRLGMFRIPLKTESIPANPPGKISITAVTDHLHYYNEKHILKIIGILHKNFIFESDDPDVLIFPSMDISFYLHFLSRKGDRISGRVTWIDIPQKNKTRFGVEIQNLDESTENMIARYLFHLHDWKPNELREMGFSFRGYRPLIKFRSLRTHEEYLNVLKLRKLAYAGANKIDKACPYESLASDLDRKSRILMAYHRDVLVGTVGIIFPDRQEMILDTERVFEKGYPITLPPKVKMMEIARLCITPEYRSTDILFGIFEHIYRILITSERDYIITSTDDHMWPLYERIGFMKVGLSYNHPVFNGLRHHIILIHRHVPLYGKGISPANWAYFYMNMTDHLIRTGAYHPTFYQKLRIHFQKQVYSFLKRYPSIQKRLS